MTEDTNKGTYFDHIDGRRLGSDSGVIPIPLYKGMVITIHGYVETFAVVDWNYHHGHGDEEAGLKIIVQDKDPIAPAK